MAAVLLILVLAATLVAVFGVSWYLKNKRTHPDFDKIPGPRPIPVLGNAHQLSPDAKKFYSQLLEYSREWAKVGIFRIWLGNKQIVAVYRAEYIEPLLNSSKHMDKADEYRFLHPWLGTGLLTSTGNKWRIRRKLLTPTFHFKILHDFIGVFNDQADVMVKKLQKVADKGPFNVFPYITLCALDIICETAMGRHVNAQGNSDSDYVQAINKITVHILLRMRRPWYWPDFLFYLLGPGREHDRCLKTLHSFTSKVIMERSEAFRQSRSQQTTIEDIMKGRGDDETVYLEKGKRLAFLDMLLCASAEGHHLSFEDIREEVDTFMFEGHDTTAAAITFCTHLIGDHPHVQDKLHEEMDQIFGDSDRPANMKDLKEMKYLECTVKEALRLFPSVPFFGRSITEDVKLGDQYTLKKDTTAVIVPVALHLDERYFPDPYKFDPDRFLPENANRHPYSYIPFSAGPRNCIGQRFALMEEKVMLSSMLRKFDIISTQRREDLSPIGELILRPQFGVDVKLKSRK
ncbi:cytochrome P450 4V2-like isoform X1 [Mizuhopecten yessoensis]|uniref:Cytochrome P450 4V2 n=1 Tax=Mizuhopecten yessoensis TaxID=6573 RepID=A0A210QM56_MIZYE|nr:cytochrome P450 4V2-like isoform X1 [Mizuhopecten yessoensis]XP_021354816.1 cytochrome P450 4V2-like isoform X1 [Mizuhopecten yessoensis]OWF49810.1 Cytochrome P450 4V2 [Mizuhopecten yessoensis]